jgi:DNA-binding NarL/FixJ family response regulator
MREVKTAIFLALQSEPEISVVATAVNTAELLTYTRSFHPDLIILEWELKGRPMMDVLPQLPQISPSSKIFVISKPSSYEQIRDLPANENIICVDEANEAILKTIKTHHKPEEQI